MMNCVTIVRSLCISSLYVSSLCVCSLCVCNRCVYSLCIIIIMQSICVQPVCVQSVYMQSVCMECSFGLRTSVICTNRPRFRDCNSVHTELQLILLWVFMFFDDTILKNKDGLRDQITLKVTFRAHDQFRGQSLPAH